MKDIRIESLTMTNWKCFKFRKVKFDNGLNLFEQHNGYGKSSIFQAIIYCLYGTLPSSDSSSLKNDKNKPTKLELCLVDKDTNETFSIRKDIISATSKAFYYRGINETEWKKMNVGQLNDICSQFCGTKNLFPLIWSDKPIYDSQIFNLNYIKDNVLNSDFNDSNELTALLKSEKLTLSREEQRIRDAAILADGRDINRKISDLEKEKRILIDELKDSSKDENLNVSRALVCIENKKKLKDAEKMIEDRQYDLDEISEYTALISKKSIYEKIVKDYSENTGEIVDKFKMFNKSFVEYIIRENERTSECPCCHQPYSFMDDLNVETANEIIQALGKSIYTEEQYNEAKDSLELINQYNVNDIKTSQLIFDLSRKAFEVDNPEEIIERDKKSKKDKWDRLDKIDKEIKNLEMIQINYSKYLEIKSKIKRIETALGSINNYVAEKTNALIGSIIFEATRMLSSVDSKYLSMYYNLDDNCFDVLMVQNDDMKRLSHNLLSGGEKSLLAISLIMAYRKILRERKNVPSFILLDESLSSLDKDHLNKCLKVIENSGCQSLIVNHN